MRILGESLLTDVLTDCDSTDGVREIRVSEPSDLWLSFIKTATKMKASRISFTPQTQTFLELADKHRFSAVLTSFEAALVTQTWSTDRQSPAYCLLWLEIARRLHLSTLFEVCRSFISPNLSLIDGLNNVDCCLADQPFRACIDCTAALSQPSALMLLRDATRQLSLCQTALDGILRVLSIEGLKVDLVQSKVTINDWQRWKRMIQTPPAEAANVKTVVQRRSTCSIGSVDPSICNRF